MKITLGMPMGSVPSDVLHWLWERGGLTFIDGDTITELGPMTGPDGNVFISADPEFCWEWKQEHSCLAICLGPTAEDGHFCFFHRLFMARDWLHVAWRIQGKIDGTWKDVKGCPRARFWER